MAHCSAWITSVMILSLIYKNCQNAPIRYAGYPQNPLLNSRIKREKKIYLLHDVFPSFDNTIISSPLLDAYFFPCRSSSRLGIVGITSVSVPRLFVSRLPFPFWGLVAIKMEYTMNIVRHNSGVYNPDAR